MGFYFSEISLMTSSNSGGGLKKFRIPAVVIIILAWCFIIISGAVTASNKGGGEAAILYQVSFAFILTALLLQLVLNVLGGLSVLLSLSGNSRRGELMRIVFCSLLGSLILFGFGVSYSKPRNENHCQD
jgi:hypothetical protein